MSRVDVDNLAKAYLSGSTRQAVFDGLTFGVAQGETVALLGASGSGKTTLLNLISGIDSPGQRQGIARRHRCSRAGGAAIAPCCAAAASVSCFSFST